MPIDREATRKKAETLLRRGKLSGAIEAYVRLVEDQPRDWNSINALGDLYVRAGDADRAVTQFTTVADHLFDEGFLPRASALYKKALRVRNDDHALVRLIDIAERQGLMADVKAYLRELSRQRRDRGDAGGEVDCQVRLASLADADEVAAADRFVLTLSDVSIDEPVAIDPEPPGAELMEASKEATVLEPREVDLSATLATLRAQALVLPPMPAMRDGKAGAKDLEAIFDELRSRVARDQQVQATEQYERGVRHLNHGRIVDAIADLQAAARMPILRFKAASSLGRVLIARGEVRDAVDWMERAAEAPPPTQDEGRALLYELADALESLGETARALAILIEVEAESGAYRDVRDRIDRLNRAQEGNDTP